jgi:hypothetical protein
MKKYILALLCVLVAFTAAARLFGEFRGWNELIEHSPNIVIAKCTSSVDTLGKPYIIQNGWVPSEIEVLTVLKGNTKIGPAHMMSTYWPHPGERFLLFGNYQENPGFTNYSINEEYRVVPLNHYFQTNMLGGTNLQEQIRWVLQNRLQDLNEELAKAQAEKIRLEEGLKGLK